MSNYVNATIFCKETILMGNITAHAFANLSLKSSRMFFCPSLWVTFFFHGYCFF